MTTFSNLSNPDIILTIHAYVNLKKQLKAKLEIQEPYHIFDEENKMLIQQIARLDHLVDSLINEWEKRGNS